MPRLSTTKKQNKQKKNGKSAQRRSTPKGSNEVLTLARLLADPCEAPLVAPQYGASDGGYLSKFSLFHNLDVSTTGSSGYVLWFPDYAGGESSAAQGSLYMFASTDADTGPLNTVAAPLGRGVVASTQGRFLIDPSHAFGNGDLVQDSRAIAGCIKMMYTGRNDSLAGRMGYLENVPREALLTGGGGVPPSVNQLFKYSNKSQRTPLDIVENKHRPGEGSEFYRRSNVIETDFCFVQGSAGTAATSLATGTPSGSCHGIGFIWDGLTDDSSLSFDFLKAIEWRPDMNSGLTAPTPTVSKSGGNLVSRSVAYLDQHHAGWQRAVYNGAVSLGGTVAKLAYEGPLNEIVRRAAPLALTML